MTVFAAAVIVAVVLLIVQSNRRNSAVDIVYTWVDGSDENFRKLRKKHLDINGIVEKHAATEDRFASKDEIYYSLLCVKR
jgi:hypothetical protein